MVFPQPEGPSTDSVITSYSIHYTKLYDVLGLMADQGLISSTALTKSLGRPLSVIPVPRQWRFPFYLDLVKRRLLKEYREKDLKTT